MKPYLKSWKEIAKSLRPYLNISNSPYKYGISSATLTGFMKRHQSVLPVTFSVNDLTEYYANIIYEAIIDDFNIDAFVFPIDIVVFDMFIQHNPNQVAITLQRTINTIKAIHNKTDFIDVNAKYTPYLIHYVVDFSNDYGIDLFTLELINRRYSWLSRIASRKKHTLNEISDWLYRLHKLHTFIYGNGKN